jgi:hypothetical protein
MVRLFVVLTCFIICSCNKKENRLKLRVYRAVRTEYLDKIISKCDSITNDSLSEIQIDTSSLSIADLLEYRKLPNRPIKGRLSNIVSFEMDSGFYRYNSSVFYGQANVSDTQKIKKWLSSSKCMTELVGLSYRWVNEKENRTYSKLIALKDENPVLSFQSAEIDSLKFEPVKGILQSLDVFTGVKASPN